MTRQIVVLLALCGSALHAQQQPFVGAWQMSYPAGMRIEGDVETPIIGTGLLTIEAQGDSLIGTLVTDPTPEMPARPPSRLAAKAGAGEVTFISIGKATININGSERETKSVSTWVLRANGEAIEGTVQRSIEGVDGGTQPPRPVSGTRRKG